MTVDPQQADDYYIEWRDQDSLCTIAYYPYVSGWFYHDEYTDASDWLQDDELAVELQAFIESNCSDEVAISKLDPDSDYWPITYTTADESCSFK